MGDLIKLQKRQKSYFKASVENTKIANDAISKTQNGLLILGIAELTFLGDRIFNNQADYILKTELFFIVIFLLTFFIGSFLQYQHALKTAREYFKLSRKILEFIEEGSKVENIPKKLSYKENAIKSSVASNWLFNISILGILISTTIIFVEILLM